MTQLLSNDITRAIGWTLIHSLWQGLVLALVAGILILFTRKTRPALRYNIFTALFFLLVACAGLTFVYELQQAGTATAHVMTTAAQVVPEETVVTAEGAITALPEPGFMERFIAYFNEHTPLLVMLWFIVFVARSLWLFGGLVYLQRIRHYRTVTPDVQLLSKMAALAGRLGLRRKVALLESAIVKVPTALGMLKPVILMPLGLMAQLPADQVEAVLLHELAHIRRRDFLVNLLQHFAETVFFFNPALLWLSARIREEREHCCDDIAITVTQSRAGYIQALVSFQEYRLQRGLQYAVAFPGRKKQLLGRVKRILGAHNNTLNIAEKSFLLLCFSLIGMLGIVFSQPEKKQAERPAHVEQVIMADEHRESVKPDEAREEDSVAGTAPVPEADAATVPDHAALQAPDTFYKEPYRATYQPYQPYQPKRDTVPVLRKGSSVMSGTVTTTVNGTQYKISIDNNRTTGLVIDGVKVPDEELPAKYPLISDIFRGIERDYDAAEKERRVQEAQRIADEKIREAAQQQLQLQLQQRLQATSAKLATTGPVSPAGPISPTGPLSPVLTATRPIAPPTPAMDNLSEYIIQDLLKEGIITQKTRLSFRLDRETFIVNDKPQPEALRQQFQRKYIKSPGDVYDYRRNGDHTTTHINID